MGGRGSTVYDAAGGADGLLALAHAWHELADDVVAHAFGHGDHPDGLVIPHWSWDGRAGT